ncbi:MAG: DotU family type IV/VI secretion system protein, partial [Pseudomonadota bacterium]|nr:DotU family type IV/VI secretion system protein [Pseudomonadota bacterium]
MADAELMDMAERNANAGQDTVDFDQLMFSNQPAEAGPVDPEAGGFQLRGLQDNRLMDAATPLLGLVLRVRRLADNDSVEHL